MIKLYLVAENGHSTILCLSCLFLQTMYNDGKKGE